MKEHPGQRKWKAVVIACVALSSFLCAQILAAAPKMEQSKAKGGDCAACHGAAKVLPKDHADTKEMTWAACKACHSGNLSLTGKLPGSHAHQLSTVNCVKCHGATQTPEALTQEQCVACHGPTAKLAEKTQNVKPKNPHTSPHYGTDLDCTLCHHQHAKSENYCNQCHQFNFKVP